MRNQARRKISPMFIRDSVSPRNRTAKGCSLYVNPFHRPSCLTNNNEVDMNFNASPSQKSAAVKGDDDGLVAMAPPDGKQASLESSDDDGPLMNRRRVREIYKENDDNTALRERGSRRDAARDHRREADDPTRNRPITRQLVKTPAKHASKHKKPSTSAYSAKPMKNDMKAKQAVVREIEGFWGRGFIKTYIPKCHRPLTKRGNGGKRSIYRKHEMDPMKWLPSVLKAILMIAKLTDNKEWLRRAMTDIVRYRIKHTGNRKPQLVTTDFDVIEDMLVKDWSVAYSFEIRYKHLLVNRKDQEEDDENIDRILQMNSDKDTEDSDQDDEIDNDEEEQDEEIAGYNDESEGHGGISAKYLRTSGYTKESRHSTPGPTRQQSKQSKPRKETPKQKSQSPQEHSRQQLLGTYGYGAPIPGYGPPLDPWGRPMPGYGGPGTYNNGYGGYGVGPGSYHFYGPPTHNRGTRQDRHHSNSTYGMPHYPPPQPAMTPAPSIPDSDLIVYGGNSKKRSRSSPSTANKRARNGYGQSPDPDFQIHTPTYPGDRLKIKHESPIDIDARRSLTNEQDDGNNNHSAREDDVGDDDIDDAAVADAEVAAMELELKLAKLKAARMREKLKKK
jgi:hypothetical protein